MVIGVLLLRKFIVARVERKPGSTPQLKSLLELMNGYNDFLSLRSHFGFETHGILVA